MSLNDVSDSNTPLTNESPAMNWLDGDGEMRRRIREFDWSRHVLGNPAQWPQSLKTVIRIMLDSRYAMWMGWGSGLTFFCNDAYSRDTLGKKHSWALGRPAREVWAEIWGDIGPRIESVLKTGKATWDEGLLLFLERSGYLEETYHTFSYSPLYDDQGKMGGMLCVVTEETKRVISERRMEILRELAANTPLARTMDEAYERFVQTLEACAADVPFALAYLFDESRTQLSLKSGVRISLNTQNIPAEIWPMAEMLSSGKPILVSDLTSANGKFSHIQWPEQAHSAVVLPIPGTDTAHPMGAIVFGISPRRAFDNDYEGFFQLVAAQLATALFNIQSFEKERQRVEALVELDRAKTAFFSNVSHEFRTPLTLMLGPLEELLSGGHGSDETQKTLEVIHRNSLRLLKLVNTLLDFSRIEAGRTQGFFEPVDLQVYTKELASVFQSTMTRGGLTFNLDIQSLPHPVYINRDMWEKIVFNLLSNAFKFTLEGSVTVTLASVDDRATLSVADTGAGIPETEVPNLFKRFHRIQTTRARTYEGTGIGLAFVHELVKLHAGVISVRSKWGVGSVFTVSIPYGKEHLPAERVVPAQPPSAHLSQSSFFTKEAIHWLPESASNTFENSPPAANSNSAKKPLVMVVDDNSDMREYISRLLSGKFQLEMVGDGVDALESARRCRPDLILSDVMMPRMDGFALVGEIRKDQNLKTIPIILLSARAGEDACAEGIQQSADDYLVKPFTGRELVARLESHLRLARMRSEVSENERRLRTEAQSSKQRLDSVLSSIEEQFFILDSDWCYIYVNDRVVERTGMQREALLGKRVQEIFPAIWEGEFRDQLIKAAAERRPVNFEFFYEPWEAWFDVRAYPTAEGMAVVSAEITTKKRMEDQLLHTQEELIQMNKALEERVDQRTASLREAIGQMEEFSYSVSHDLRSPLRAVQGYARVLAEDYAGALDSGGMEYLNRILQSSSRMERLINDVLTYTRVSRREIQLQPVSLDSIVHEAIAHYPELDPARVHINVQKNLPSVVGHELSLSQVVSNLLNNAVKFVAPGAKPEVTIRSERNNGTIRLWIEDNGIGIRPEHQHRLFGMFERIHPDTLYDGTGIGLAIVRKVTERLGGRVGVESDGVHGSKFWIELRAV